MRQPSEPRMTIPTQRVLRALLSDPAQERYGLEICAEAGLPSGTVHPILARLEGAGWLESRWEDVDPRTEGRPARRYYRLSGDGAASARQALARAYRPRASQGALRPTEDAS
jgi:PadR family transcriptional regulator, regulatory protein PadR